MALANGAEAEPVDQSSHPEIEQHSAKVLMLGALGVVYGDIGTSPIYAFREALHASSGGDVANRADILGVLSLIIWSLTITVTVKYIMFVLRADNRGEGGVLSLMALARGTFPTRSAIVLGIGIVGASLFFGDAVITPAISVLSAVEGMNVVTPAFQPYVVPLTLLILAAVFAVQRFGTGGVGLVFGPVTAIWFLAIGVSGLKHIISDPEILWAISPHYIVAFFINSPDVSFVTVGAVFLAVTGAEALYADLGHFGRKPIVLAWLAIVFPCLLLNYAGQGAYVLAKGGTVGHPFFEMNEGWALIPMVVLATAATVIASQAVISGAYSLTRQAVQLNMLPRLEILHTSEKQSGQVYMPRVNMLLALVVMLLVVGFGESSRLASAYGISVTGNMLVTTTLLFIVMTRIWKWNIWPAIGLTAVFALIDIGFFASNIVKVFEGGWASLAVAFAIILGMWTWVRGSRYLFDKTRRNEIPLDFLAGNLLKKKPQLVSGTAVFLTSDPLSAPTALMHSLKHYKVLHEKNVILSVVTAPQPVVPDSERVKLETVNELFMRVTLTFGYMEQPNIPRALAICRKQGWKFDIMTTSFFLSRRSLKASPNSGMPIWQDRLFIGLAKTASDATEYFQIPTGRVVEIGTQVAI
ncbi:potassium transporter Kup [Mesorhizobium sp. ESP-6-4]|uniref:potassium transporter Kup n=1 Tax=unclassified Mesorhizobium TaxID=325217 RepID=UPI00112AA170|nr:MULTISPECIES: potassium transporter Kup [unclassified Mesorhizobium]MBZ9657995.1 potassium transporter Kup [Mesorhizobium sp. ESP-6-4]MBZ9732458.1 potassium transporter Kup [Mesorhizobium sp. CA9]MBZ9823897.1 potassium transporter Kup [Mesorhizobium sp. CA18]MBZ9830125.1 potassium transporter Kup [Mesorhizobium sp. CA2]MBZ9835777.1 potassium transporter Kup [Mesorhizobium sp. CA3]